MSNLPIVLLALTPRYSAEGWEAILSEPSWLAALAVLVMVSIWSAISVAWREQRALMPGRWKWLAALRVISILLVLALLASLQRRPVSEQVDPSRVVVLVDSSTSMSFAKDTQTSEAPVSSQISRSAAAIEISHELGSLLSESHRMVSARCGELVSYYMPASDEETQATKITLSNETTEDFYSPLESQSRLGESLQKILEDYSSTPLSAVILLSDGRTTDGISAAKVAEDYATKGVHVHTIGFGSLVEPKRIELRSLSVPRQVQIRDPFEATIRLNAMGNFSGTVDVEFFLLETSTDQEKEIPLKEAINAAKVLKGLTIDVSAGETVVTEKVELDPPQVGKYQLIAKLIQGGQTKLLDARFESIDKKLQVMLIASAPLRDYRFLRNQLFRDDSFEVDALLQSATGGISQDVRTVRESFPIDLEELNEYDVVVAYDVDWLSLGDEAIDLLRTWVSQRGGGFLVIGGTVNSFQLVEQPPESALATLLPVRFRADPLALVVTQSASTKEQKVLVAPEAESTDFLQIGTDPIPGKQPWNELKGFYQNAPTAELKLGSTPYLLLGDSETDIGEDATLLSDQFFGAGRAGYLATPEMWRLRKIDEKIYTAFYTRYLRHLARGRLQGASAVANLYFDREQYQIGQTMSARLVMREEVLQSSEQQELNVVWSLPDGKRTTQTLRPLEGQLGSFETSWVADQEGQYRLSVRLPRVDEPLVATTQSILPPRESAVRTQDVDYLQELAQATGGVYLDSSEELTRLVDQTPSRAETRLVLGPLDEEFGDRIARYLLIGLTSTLAIEWLLRRWWRLA